MSDVIGVIDTSISLAIRLHTLVKSYADAPETAASMRLFNSQLSTVRLRLLRTALDRDTNGNIPGNWRPDIKEARKAAPLLKDELEGAINQLESLQTDRVTGRIMWAIWNGERVTEIFNGIHRKIDVLERIVILANVVPNLKSDTFEIADVKKIGHFRPLSPYYYVQVNLVVTQKTTAAHRPPLDVLVESYRNRDSDETNKEKKDRNALEKAKSIAERLWWTCDNNTGFRTGLLPCIGIESYRVLFLLPENAEKNKQQTLRNLICGPTIVPLETRFAFALQLAEALLKVHLAGLMHCDIRSDNIIFLAASENQATDDQVQPGIRGGEKSNKDKDKPVNEQDDPLKTNAIKRNGTVQIAQRAMTGAKTRAMSFFSKNDKTERQGRSHQRHEDSKTKRQTSESGRGNRPRKNGGLIGSIVRSRPRNESADDLGGQSLPAEQVNQSDDNKEANFDTSVAPEGGKVPPRTGSVYLVSWATMHYRSSIIPARSMHWYLDVYRHPQQQGRKAREMQHNMGHDIYSLGVCLLEIGLWKSLVGTKKGPHVYGPLAQKAFKDGMLADKPEEVKKRLVEIAKEDLPGAMGTSYARLVEECLTCLDTKESFGEADFHNYKLDCEEFRRIVLSFLLDANKLFAASNS